MSAAGFESQRAVAPAKLNLGLRVTGVRADGYHLLDSVFVPFDLADELAIVVEPAPAARVVLTVDGGPPGLERDARNLAARAAERFLAAAGLAAEVRIALTKRIPVGAGLGGGSSDAGAVLRVLAARFPDALDPARLAALAAALGADVPFFLDPRPARVGGIGDEIEPIAGFPSFAVVTVTPAPPLPTAEVFAAWDRAHPAGAARESAALTPAEPGRRMPPLPSPMADDAAGDAGSDRGWDRWQALLGTLLLNDLEPMAAVLRPAVRRVRAAFDRAGARAVGMSGSGPTVFALFGTLDEARAAASRIDWEPTDRVHVGRTTGSA